MGSAGVDPKIARLNIPCTSFVVYMPLKKSITIDGSVTELVTVVRDLARSTVDVGACLAYITDVLLSSSIYRSSVV